MKRRLFSLIIVLPLSGLFFSSEIHAQSGDGKLPEGPKPGGTAGAGGARPASGPPILAFGVERKGKLEPKTSMSESFSEEMILNAKSEDSLVFRIQSDGGGWPLSLQILDKNKKEVAVAKDLSGAFIINTSTRGLPANGEYRVRVKGVVSGKSAVPFTIKVERLGLTGVAYVERFNKIYSNYNQDDPASVDETQVKLEKLAKEAPNHPAAFERLGMIYLQVRKDTAKAGWAMEQAIKAKGAARFGISYDGRWREMAKLRGGGFGFEDKRVGWLRIQSGMLTLHDSNNKVMVTLTGQQITELSSTIVSAYSLVRITTNNKNKSYIIAPEAMRQVEADLVVKLIQNHVVGKAY